MGLAVLVVTFAVHQAIPSASTVSREEAFLPKPQFAKLASLGFDAVLSDYYWIQAIYTVGSTRERPSEFSSYVAKIIDLVTTLDPHVKHPYRFGAIWLTDSPQSVREGNALLRRGIAHHPDDWRNYFYLGYNLFYYLNENAAAADVLAKCSKLEGAPAYLPRLVARLRSENSDLEAAVIFLSGLVQTTESEEERVIYRGALDEIDVEIKARYLDRAREAYQELAGRDITSVFDLTSAEYAVLESLPAPEPRDLPSTLHKGDRWFVDPSTGQITSSYYNRRYRVNARARGEQWRDTAAPTTAARGVRAS